MKKGLCTMTRSSSSDLDARVMQRAQVLAQDTSYDWLRPRPRRRALVIIQNVVIVGMVINALVRQPSLRQSLIGLGLMIIGFVGVIFLRAAMRGMADFPDAAMDERVVTTRNAAYLSSYRLLASGTAIALFAWWLLATVTKQTPSVDSIINLMMCFLIASVSLPSCVLAWTETDARLVTT
jgi:hypothetical protein